MGMSSLLASNLKLAGHPHEAVELCLGANVGLILISQEFLGKGCQT